MKKGIILIALLAFAFIASAGVKGKVQTMTADSVQGNENVTFNIPVTGEYASLIISAKVTRVSTAAGGTLTLKAGSSTSDVFTINQSTNPALSAAPNDSLATADVATQYVWWEIKNPGAMVYQIFCDGDVNDTIIVTPSYVLK